MKRFFTKQKAVWRTTLAEFYTSSGIVTTTILFVAILFLLQWLFNIDQLIDIVFGDSGLSLADRIDFLIDGFFNIFRLIDDFVPVSLILIALLQALAIMLILRLRNVVKQNKRAFGSLVLGLIGSGCVACGGSVLTPLLSVIATNASLTVAETFANILLVLAVILSYRALMNIALVFAHHKAQA